LFQQPLPLERWLSRDDVALHQQRPLLTRSLPLQSQNHRLLIRRLALLPECR
jgi:hypothetical protein